MSHGPTQTPAVRPGGGPQAIIGGLVLLLAILGALWFGYYRIRQHKTKANQNAEVPAAQAPASSQMPDPVTHKFGPDGCFEKYIIRARWSPIDWPIKVCNPSGQCHVEAIGDSLTIPTTPPGVWKFCKEDSRATGIFLWE